MFAYLVLCLHWFNPLVWAAFVLMGADMEMSCDECVIRKLGGEIKNAYSLSLVRVAAGRKI
jgi:beta-lactamase regulating signal transducer with metallopeptidase domain